MKSVVVKAIEKYRGWSKVQRGLLVVLAVILCLVLLIGGRLPHEGNKAVSRSYATRPPEAEEPQKQSNPDAIVDDEKSKFQELQQETKQTAPPASPLPPGTVSGLDLPTMNPLIAHTAELAVATKEFVKSRTSLEEILEHHRGYAARLRMVGQKSGSVLSATLRVPSTELIPTVSDLKTLGDVEREEQSADEVTQQRADLDARVANAKNTLRRLQELLAKQSYPDGNVRELQRQIANATAEVARLQAERRTSEERVVFANIKFTLREEVSAPVESLSAQLRSAATTGFGDAMASVASLLVFFIGRGPMLVLWAAILYVPARFVWKKWAPVAAQAN